MRWIAEIGPSLPKEVRRTLRSTFFLSKAPLLIGAGNTIGVAAFAYYRSGNPVFACIALLDMLLLGLRLKLLRRVHAPSDPVFATGLLWSLLQGVTLAIVVSSMDIAMCVITLATSLGATGGIIGRNFAAPRYALSQVLILDVSFKLAFSWRYPDLSPLVALQSVPFYLISRRIVRQHRRTAIQALMGELQSREQAFTDPLTGLLNRRGLEDAFARMDTAPAERALLYLDLDGFKAVNDRLGHCAGDQLLKQVGQRLREIVGPAHFVSRLGGDEFVVLVESLPADETLVLGNRLVVSLCVPYEIAETTLARIGVSVGAVAGLAEPTTLTDMLKCADLALYKAKASGKGRCVLHAPRVDDLAESA